MTDNTITHKVKNRITIPHTQFVYTCVNCQNPKFIINEINYILSAICTECGRMLALTETVLDREDERKKHSPEGLK